MHEREQGEMGWADRPGPKRVIRLALYTVCALLLLAEVAYHRHTVHAVEELPAFYALYGFAALLFAVMAAKGLRRLVGRGEDYYDDDA